MSGLQSPATRPASAYEAAEDRADAGNNINFFYKLKLNFLNL